jgi:hypothetical protein
MRPLHALIAGLGIFLAGCTTDIANATRKAGVRSVTVERRVDINSPLRAGFKSDSGNLSAALAELTVNEIYAKKISRLGTVMQTNEIRVPEMVRNRVSELLHDAKGLEVVTNKADATLVVAIGQYGFEGGSSGGSKNVPFIVLRAELMRGGDRIWKGQGQIHPWLSGKLGADLDQYYSQPNLLREHWQIQIDRAARQLLHVEKRD